MGADEGFLPPHWTLVSADAYATTASTSGKGIEKTGPLGILLLFLVGTVVYNVRFGGNLFSLLAGISLGASAFFALGYALVGLVPSAPAVVVIGNVVIYPLMIFSGAMVPLEVMPETVRTISRYLLRERMGGSPDRGGRVGRRSDRWDADCNPDFPRGIEPCSASTARCVSRST